MAGKGSGLSTLAERHLLSSCCNLQASEPQGTQGEVLSPWAVQTATLGACGGPALAPPLSDPMGHCPVLSESLRALAPPPPHPLPHALSPYGSTAPHSVWTPLRPGSRLVVLPCVAEAWHV